MTEGSSLPMEAIILGLGIAAYAAAALAGAGRRGPAASNWGIVLGLLVCGVIFLGAAIAERWLRVGYGPFITLYEVLLSNLFTLGLIYALVYWLVPAVRPATPAAVGVLLLLGAWSLAVPRLPSRLPPTYENPWLWVHVGVGKIFLGSCLVAASLAGLLLKRSWRRSEAGGCSERLLDTLAWRFLAVAFVFHSLMLIAGAVWAQDAWGRYWSWDPLETWAFLTWLAMAVLMHARVTYRVPDWLGWSMIIAIFILAFATFFGVPFVSIAPHKGAI
ncbi:MAG: cytochrome c biogenesis protein CcsA [Deltaproteobacteria bacterium]|nr:cytochrome c biogenesis protein CcsA [Deltaproteobacteria bacterium]